MTTTHDAYSGQTTEYLETLLRQPDLDPANRRAAEEELTRRLSAELLSEERREGPATGPSQAASTNPLTPGGEPLPHQAPVTRNKRPWWAGLVAAVVVAAAVSVLLILVALASGKGGSGGYPGNGSQTTYGSSCVTDVGVYPLTQSLPVGSTCYVTNGYQRVNGVVN